MALQALFALVTAWTFFTLHATTAAADDVLCYENVDELTGECLEYLGEGVSENDCCLNIKYGFKRSSNSQCEGCRPAAWSPWSEWSPCTVSCSQGVQQRKRICIGQGDCVGDDIEVQVCSLKDCCPRFGGWSEWSGWSACSATCERGQRKRTRQCDNPAPACGGSCRGSNEEVEKCDTFQVCPTHGQWGNWGGFGQCSSACVVEGSGRNPTQLRFRKCDNPAPSSFPPGNPCPGSDSDSRDCTGLPACPVDGQWGAWQKASECTVTCGIGRVQQKRSCNNPAPKHGGNNCVGSPVSHTLCNTQLPCPIDGAWGNWEEWSVCRRLTDDIIKCKERPATQSRKRKCVGTQYEGKWCDGENREGRSCYNIDGCFLPRGTWSEWSQWGLCSPPCGKSERKRFRECLPKYPDYPNMVQLATGNLVEAFFWGTPKFRCDELNGQVKKVEEAEECKNTLPCS